MTEAPACKHEKTRLIAKDNEAEYIECLACGAILDRHELTAAPPSPQPEAPQANPPAASESVKANPFDESLSDA